MSGAKQTPLRVLVVDDRFADRLSLRRMLELQGHSVSTASDGAEALLLAEQFLPQLIFLAIDLPDFDGYEVCERIRAQAWGKAMSIFGISAAKQPFAVPKAQGHGFDGFLVKPISLPMLKQPLAHN